MAKGKEIKIEDTGTKDFEGKGGGGTKPQVDNPKDKPLDDTPKITGKP